MRLLIKYFYGKMRLLGYYNSKTERSLSFLSYILEFDKIKRFIIFKNVLFS